jgi:PAS domain-containing protein
MKSNLPGKRYNRGAQGYLLRGHFQNELVPQALRNTIERKLVEDALFVEKERAAVTLDSIGDAVISTGCSGGITYINVAAERMTGWTRQQATGRPVADVLHLIDRVTRTRIRSTGNNAKLNRIARTAPDGCNGEDKHARQVDNQ